MCAALSGARRDATSLAHQYDVYARQLELSVVDNVLLVSTLGTRQAGLGPARHEANASCLPGPHL